MRIRARLVGGAVASALSLGAWYNAQAQGTDGAGNKARIVLEVGTK